MMTQINGDSARLGQPFDQMLGFHPALGDGLRLATHGAMSFLGFWIAGRETGPISWIGTGVGVLSGLGALMDVISLVDQIEE